MAGRSLMQGNMIHLKQNCEIPADVFLSLAGFPFLNLTLNIHNWCQAKYRGPGVHSMRQLLLFNMDFPFIAAIIYPWVLFLRNIQHEFNSIWLEETCKYALTTAQVKYQTWHFQEEHNLTGEVKSFIHTIQKFLKSTKYLLFVRDSWQLGICKKENHPRTQPMHVLDHPFHLVTVQADLNSIPANLPLLLQFTCCQVCF